MIPVKGALRIPEDEQHECPICAAEDYVLYDGDKMCANCAHTPGVEPSRGLPRRKQSWEDWQAHRRQNDDYEGWTGSDRIKMVGGFVGAYDF